MKLHPEPFEKLKAGKKKIESRLWDEKRQHIRVGDEIDFFKLPDLKETLRVTVIGLERFPTFEELAHAFPLTDFCMPDGSMPEDFVQAMRPYYTEEEEKECGVVGIRVKLPGVEE